jgi:hypothetical protein
MIVSFRDGWLRDFFIEEVRSKKIPSDLESRLFRRIQMLDDATTDQDLRVPPSTILKNCAAIWKASIRSASTNNGGSSSGGMAAEARRRASIWTPTLIGEDRRGSVR